MFLKINKQHKWKHTPSIKFPLAVFTTYPAGSLSSGTLRISAWFNICMTSGGQRVHFQQSFRATADAAPSPCFALWKS